MVSCAASLFLSNEKQFPLGARLACQDGSKVVGDEFDDVGPVRLPLVRAMNLTKLTSECEHEMASRKNAIQIKP